MLRLLRLLVKHGDELPALRAILAPQFMDTPPAPWLVIVPQLFSRLGHPVPMVRETVRALIERLALAAPHTLAYPVLVATARRGSSTAPGQQVNSSLLSRHGKPLPMPATAATALLSIRSSLLRAKGPMVSRVEMLLHELRRITALWEERWHSVLQTLSGSDLASCARALRSERRRVLADESLSFDAKQILIGVGKGSHYEKRAAAIVSALEEVERETFDGREAGGGDGMRTGTRSEHHFQRHFAGPIKRAIQMFASGVKGVNGAADVLAAWARCGPSSGS